MTRVTRVGATASAVALAASLGLVATGAASAADVGDGLLSCNAGEICFAKDDGSTTYQKHFYNAADHTNITFTNVTTGATTTHLLRDNADQVRNRDTTCDVKVIDDRGLYPDDVQVIPNNGNWTTLDDSVDNENDRHERAC